MRFLLLGFVGIWALVAWLEWSSPVIRPLIHGRPVEIAILGLDEAEGTSRADTIILVRFEPESPAVKILQIPRDLTLPGSAKKINSLLSQAPKGHLKPILNSFLPHWKLEPVRTIQLRFDAFLKIIESLGTVSWNEEPLRPEESLELVRSRSQSGDWGRLHTQKSYLATLGRTLMENPWKWPRLLIQWKDWAYALKTDLNAFEALSLWARARACSNPTQLFFYQVPTTVKSAGTLAVDSAASEELAQWWAGDPLAPFDKDSHATFEVLNASPESGLAMKMTRLLRKHFSDVDVIYFGTNPTSQEASFLVLRQASLRLAKQVQVKLNKKIGLELVQWVSPSRSKGVDFSLVLGQGAGQAWNLDQTPELDGF